MTFPSVVGTTETAMTTAATAFPVNFVQTTGDLVVIFVGRPSSVSISSVTNGFNVLSPGPARCQVIYKKLVGTEGGTCTVNYAGSAKGAAIAYNIQGYDLVRAPSVSLISTGTSTGPDPQSCTAPAGARDNLWISGFVQAGEELDDDTWCNSAPSGFSSLLQKTTGTAGTAGTNCSVATAIQQLNASSLDAGLFNTDQSLAWGALTVCIAPFEVWPTAYALKEAAKSVYKRLKQAFPLLMSYPETGISPPEGTPETPHFFANPMRRYHKSGRFF